MAAARLLAVLLAALSLPRPGLGEDPRQGAPAVHPSHRRRPLLSWEDGGRERPVTSPAEWRARRSRILAAMEEVMGDIPARGGPAPLDPLVTEEVRGERFRRQRISFAAEPGDRVPAYLFLPDPPPARRVPAMLALHQTTSIGKAEPAGLGGLANLHYGVELARRGYVVLCPDYPSFGEYPYDFGADGHPSGSIKGVINHMRCIDLLESRPEVDASRMGVIGHSLGGHNAMFAAAFDERIRVIVSSCGWTTFEEYKGGRLEGWTSERYMPRIRDVYGLDPARMPFDFDEVVAAFAPRPFLSVSPIGDDNFSVAGVRKGMAAAKGVYELLGAGGKLEASYPDCGHDFPLEARRAAYAFIDRALGEEKPEARDLAPELPRIPPLAPEAALGSFETAPGFRIEIAAAEPLVTDPVALAFDERGRLFAVEMNDYPNPGSEVRGKVRLLEDRDRDGRFERSTVYAGGLSWPTAVICWDGGIFVGAAPDILYMKDTDGDGRADESRVVFTGFGRQNVQGLLNSFQWGLDHRIHGATGTCGGIVRRAAPDGASVDLNGRDFSFDPRALDLAAETGGAQHGMSFDDWGRKFVCSNSDHIQLVVMDERPRATGTLAGGRASIAADGPQAEVFRRSPVEPWRVVRTRLRVAGLVPGPVEGGGRASGYFTSATGVTIYRGDAWPAEDRGRAIVGDVGSNIIHRKAIEPDGASLSARRIDPGKEFVSSSDIWFRPVQFANAPDGALYVADMYREVIEHPESLPPEIKKHLDLSSGRDRGRIWRIVPEGFRRPAPPALAEASTPALAAALGSRNGWIRDTAARLLHERQDPSARAPLEAVASGGSLPEARVHALSALAVLRLLTPEVLLGALRDAHPRVRERAVHLAGEAPAGTHPAVLERLPALAGDEDPRVRLELALTMGGVRASSGRLEALVSLLRRDAGERWTRGAVIRALEADSAEALAKLAADRGFRSAPGGLRVLEEIAAAVGARGELDEAGALFQTLSRLPEEDGRAELSILRGLGEGLARAGKSLGETARGSGREAEAILARCLQLAKREALDRSLGPAERIEAVRALSLGESIEILEGLASLLEGREPHEVQLAVLAALGRLRDPRAGEAILGSWSRLSPRLRAAAAEALFSRQASLPALLDAMERGDISAAEIDPARLRRLESHPDPEIRSRAARIAAGAGSRPRDEVLAAYRGALDLGRDPVRGEAVFRRSCAGCHKAGAAGHEIAPSLAAAASRGAEALLLAILDPNREVHPQYVAYAAMLEDGRTVTGIIAAESAEAITLRRAEGATDTVLRSEIAEMRSSGVSLMPEGLEREIDPPSMADLIGYILSLTTPP